jgi:hypothetical protein
LARWDGRTWASLPGPVGEGVNNTVYALALRGDALYVGGAFDRAGGVAANGIARWNGTTWQPLGAGVNGTVRALLVSGADLYVAGQFTSAGDVVAHNLARWNGSAWSAVGGGTNDTVYALTRAGNNLVVAGRFTTAGDRDARHIARWNGTAWFALSGGTSDAIYALAFAGTDLYAGGSFRTAGGTFTNEIARWDGRTWTPLGSGANDPVQTLLVQGDSLYAGGLFREAGAKPALYFGRWSLDTSAAQLRAASDAGAPGSYFVFTGRAFTPALPLDIMLNGRRIGTVTADAGGQIQFALFMPSQATPGTYTVVSRPSGAGVAQSAQVTIAVDPTAPLLSNPGGVAILRGFSAVYLPLIIGE